MKNNIVYWLFKHQINIISKQILFTVHNPAAVRGMYIRFVFSYLLHFAMQLINSFGLQCILDGNVLVYKFLSEHAQASVLLTMNACTCSNMYKNP